ncbi:MAG: NLP/P60-family secreted protein [Frankiales bacterium]|nr:NLP/P60-family secreted protein [Frankiales bacterium]
MPRAVARGAVIAVAGSMIFTAPLTAVISFVGDTAALTSGKPVALRAGSTQLIPGLVLAAQEYTPAPVAITARSFSTGATSQGLTALPGAVYAAYRNAETYAAAADPGCHLSWSVLAGIGQIESHQGLAGGSARPGWNGTASPPLYGPTLDGRIAATAVVRDTDGGKIDGDAVYDRAVGPLQFLPSTWSTYGTDTSGDGVADPQNIVDASATAGLYLCAGGGDLADPRDLITALARYNHSDSYIRAVLAASSGYLAASLGPNQPGVAQAALAFGYAHLGDPYLWGGTGPLYDCSGLTQAAYLSAGIRIPRTAEQQWQQLPHVPLEDLLPGDLVFSSPGEFVAGQPGHVGLYLGAGLVLDDPHTGAVVRIDSLDGLRPLVGAARPSMLTTYPGAPSPGTGLVLPPVVPGPTLPPPVPVGSPGQVGPFPTPVFVPSPTTPGTTPETTGSATAVPEVPGSPAPVAVPTSLPTPDSPPPSSGQVPDVPFIFVPDVPSPEVPPRQEVPSPEVPSPDVQAPDPVLLPDPTPPDPTPSDPASSDPAPAADAPASAP